VATRCHWRLRRVNGSLRSLSVVNGHQSLTRQGEKIQSHLAREMAPAERQALRAMLRQRYDWSRIAARTAAVYRSLL
jgi:glycosyltransferase involved in cell wall biosynthesis